MAAELTSVANVKVRAGIPAAVTTNDASLTLIVAGVNARIAEVCSRNFTYQTYSETRQGNGNNEISLRNGPIETIFYAGTGGTGAITIKYVGSALGTIDVKMDMGGDSDGVYQIKMIEGVTITTIDITTVKTLSNIVAELDALPNWEAAIEGSLGAYPALSIVPHSYAALEANEEISIQAADSPISLEPIQRVDGEYDASRNISKRSVINVIYQGGYDIIPPALVDAATQIALNTYNLSKTDQTLGGETIGNYSWTSAISNFIDEQLPAWYSVLNNFKNPALA